MKVALIFFGGLLLSSLSLVVSRHESRKLVNEIELMRVAEAQIRETQNKLLIERGYWGSPSRIEELAVARLKMKYPGTKDERLLIGVTRSGADE